VTGCAQGALNAAN